MTAGHTGCAIAFASGGRISRAVSERASCAGGLAVANRSPDVAVDFIPHGRGHAEGPSGAVSFEEERSGRALLHRPSGSGQAEQEVVLQVELEVEVELVLVQPASTTSLASE
ncbi:flavin-containing monooxygenase [Streptomyces laurentii]|uniref:Flavin-containing monooxygenase n=1 Tax=Streptomyces laurentii TaxID=39478 RepID=A0A160NST7_STRLU|nr:flavin-containing monooxygenase [Streptomyces laurentii]